MRYKCRWTTAILERFELPYSVSVILRISVYDDEDLQLLTHFQYMLKDDMGVTMAVATPCYEWSEKNFFKREPRIDIQLSGDEAPHLMVIIMIINTDDHSNPTLNFLTSEELCQYPHCLMHSASVRLILLFALF